MCEQFLEGQPALGWIEAHRQLFQAGAYRRVVHELQRLHQRGKLQGIHDTPGQQVRGTTVLQLLQCAVHQLSHASLGHPFGQRIDRRELCLEGLRLPADAPVFRVHDLQPQGATTHFAEAAQRRAPCQAVNLGL